MPRARRCALARERKVCRRRL